MSSPDTAPDELAEAEKWMRDEIRILPGSWTSQNVCQPMLTELDRLRAELAVQVPVVQAATVVTEKWADMLWCYQSTQESAELGDLLDALHAAVKNLEGEGDG